jgi:hypothetical protein
MPTMKSPKISGKARSAGASTPKIAANQTGPLRRGRPAKKQKSSAKSCPSEGIWYLVRVADKWKLFAHHFHPESPIEGHPAFWEQIVAPNLARSYQLSQAAARELALHHYGFPRGRVALVDGVLKFYHGNDWQRFITREEIEKCFNPDSGRSQWIFDEHETQLDWDCEQVGRMLGIAGAPDRS